MKILLADDSKAIRMVYRKIFEKLGHAPEEILEAVNGEGLLQALHDPRERIDLILADGELPGLDGHSLLKELAAQKRKIPVVLSVAAEERFFIKVAIRLGVREIILRPFSDEEIREKLTMLEASIRAWQAEEARAALKAISGAGQADGGLPFLLELPSGVLAELLAAAQRRKVRAGAALLCRGESIDRLHVITAGEAEIYDSDSPRLPDSLGMGDTFGELAFMAGGKAAYSVRARTDLELVSIDRPRLYELAQRQPKLLEILNGLTARKARAAVARPPGGSEFFGSFRAMPFADLVRLLNLSRKCGVLEIRGGDSSGEIGFDAGEVVHARLDRQTGEEAFYAISAWGEATYAFSTAGRPEKRNVGRPTGLLLAELHRRADAQRAPSASA